MSKILWQCEVCNENFSSNGKDDYDAESRVLKIDVPQSGGRNPFDDNDVFEFKSVCLNCRMKISDAIYGKLEEINPNIHEYEI